MRSIHKVGCKDQYAVLTPLFLHQPDATRGCQLFCAPCRHQRGAPHFLRTQVKTKRQQIAIYWIDEVHRKIFVSHTNVHALAVVRFLSNGIVCETFGTCGAFVLRQHGAWNAWNPFERLNRRMALVDATGKSLELGAVHTMLSAQQVRNRIRSFCRRTETRVHCVREQGGMVVEFGLQVAMLKLSDGRKYGGKNNNGNDQRQSDRQAARPPEGTGPAIQDHHDGGTEHDTNGVPYPPGQPADWDIRDFHASQRGQNNDTKRRADHRGQGAAQNKEAKYRILRVQRRFGANRAPSKRITEQRLQGRSDSDDGTRAYRIAKRKTVQCLGQGDEKCAEPDAWPKASTADQQRT